MIEPNRSYRVVLCILAVVFCACGDPSPPDTDADVEADADVETDANVDGDVDVEAEIEIEPPLPPRLTPCPTGWSEVPADPAAPGSVDTCEPWLDGGPAVLVPCPEGWREIPPSEQGEVATCDPWPPTGPEDCDVDSAHFPGDDGCSLIGSPCPSGDWAEDIPVDAAVLYVRAGGPAGGDGSADAPFATIAEATAAASEGTVVALSEGTYEEQVLLPEGVTLWGACVRETVVACPEGVDEMTGAVMPVGPDTALRNVRITGACRGIYTEDAATSIDVSDVVIDGATCDGVAVGFATASLRSVAIRNTWSYDDLERGILRRGRGISIVSASLSLERVVLEHNREMALAVNQAEAILTGSDIAIRDTLPQESTGDMGIGFIIGSGGATALLTRVVVEGSRAQALHVNEEAFLELTDAVIRDTALGLQAETGNGLLVYAYNEGAPGGHAKVSRTLFERNQANVVRARSPDTYVELNDVVIRDSQGEAVIDGETTQFAILAHDGAELHVSRAVVSDNLDGIGAMDPGTTATLEDVVVRHRDSEVSEKRRGIGLYCIEEGEMQARRAFLYGTKDFGAAASLRGNLTIEDAVIRNTHGSARAPFAIGLLSGFGSQVTAARVLVEESPMALEAQGLSTDEDQVPAELDVTDVLARDGLAEPCTIEGMCLAMLFGGRATVERARFERCRTSGVWVVTEGSSLDAQDLAVIDTQAFACDGGLGDGTRGSALGVQDGAEATIDRASFVGNREIAVWTLAPDSRLVLSNAEIRDTLERDCAGSSCADQTAGIGVASLCEAHLELSSFLVSGSPLCGVQLARSSLVNEGPCDVGGTMRLRDGAISGSGVCSINVQGADFDFDRDVERVIFNEEPGVTRLETEGGIYVPDPSIPPPEEW
jgi:hypothetical protein